MMIRKISSEIRNVLVNSIKGSISKSPPHSVAFAARLCGNQLANELGLTEILNKITWAVNYGGYPELASLGYYLAIQDKLDNRDLGNKFIEGLKRQRLRPESALEALSSDDVALLGIAEGMVFIQKIDEYSEIDELKNWLLELIAREPERKIWSSRLRDLAGDLIDNKGRLRRLTDWNDIKIASLEIVIIDLWSGKLFGFKELSDNEFSDLLSRLLKYVNVDKEQIEELSVYIKALDLLIDQNSKNLFEKTNITLPILRTIKEKLDKAATKKTRLNFFLGVLTWAGVSIIYYYIKSYLNISLQMRLDEAVPFFGAIIIYLYYSISQREFSPKEIYLHLLEKNKIHIYKKWGFDSKVYENLTASYKIEE